MVEKGEDRIIGAKPRQGAALVGVEQTSGRCYQEEAGRYYSFENL